MLYHFVLIILLALTGIPLISLNCITDIVDGEVDTADEFTKNFTIAAESLKENVCAAIDYLEGKTLKDLH